MISEEYCKTAFERLQEAQMQLELFAFSVREPTPRYEVLRR